MKKLNKILLVTSTCLSIFVNEISHANSQEELFNSTYTDPVHRFLYSQGRIEEKQNTLEWKLDDFKQQTQENFNKIDRRFEQVDRRFEQIDRRFEQIDRRFEKVDQQFQGIYIILNNITTILGEIRADIRATNERLDARIDKAEKEFESRLEQTRAGLKSDVNQTKIEFMTQINQTQIRVSKLEDHWSYRFSGSVLYNPMIYIAAGLTALGIDREVKAGQLTPLTYVSYGASVALSYQVIWNVFGASASESIQDFFKMVLFAVTCGAVYAMHLHKQQISPFITLSSVLTFSAFGAAITQAKNVVVLLSSTASEPEKK